jgi:hypothetical protein
MRRAVVLVAVVSIGCVGTEGAAVSTTSTTDVTTSTSTSTTSSTGTTDDPATTTTIGADTSTTDDGTIDGECSIWEQDCAPGEKCAPWSLEPDLIPDEVRCCPEDANAVQHGDECVVEGYLGSCLDNCVLGTMCLDFDGDGMGTCQRFCEGTAEEPMCEPDEGCFIYFAGVPYCFTKCDPLVQDCPVGNGCYPDEESNGGTGFLCLPTIGAQPVGGLCWLLSGCEPGLICVTPEFVPGCNENFGCCTSLCDITEPDVCADIDPELECVSWYIGGAEPPDVSYANVGACVIPP